MKQDKTISESEDIVFIIGMHRSGTTLLSKLIDRSGYKTGFNKEENNEPTYLIKKNDQLLNAAGCNWENPFDFQSYITEQNLSVSSAWLKRQLLKINSIELWGGDWFRLRSSLRTGADKWLLKDPRLSITFPVWANLFPNAKILHIKRHGVDVAESLRVRANKLYPSTNNIKKLPRGLRVRELQHGLKLWDYYESSCDRIVQNASDKEMCLSIRYEDLLLDTDETVRKISGFLGVCLEHGEEQFQSNRAYSFRSSDELVNFAVCNEQVLQKHGY